MSDQTSMSLLNGLRTVDNAAAWRRFVTIYEPLLQTWLRRRSVPSSIADDVLQDTLLIVSQEIVDFQHNGRVGAFRAWLRQILVHRLRTAARRVERAGEALLSDLAEQLSDPHSALTQAWDQQHNTFVLERLLELAEPRFEPKTITAFRRLFLQEEAVEQVAADLNLSVNAARIAQSRVLAALRELGEEFLEL